MDPPADAGGTESFNSFTPASINEGDDSRVGAGSLAALVLTWIDWPNQTIRATNQLRLS